MGAGPTLGVGNRKRFWDGGKTQTHLKRETCTGRHGDVVQPRVDLGMTTWKRHPGLDKGRLVRRSCQDYSYKRAVEHRREQSRARLKTRHERKTWGEKKKVGKQEEEGKYRKQILKQQTVGFFIKKLKSCTVCGDFRWISSPVQPLEMAGEHPSRSAAWWRNSSKSYLNTSSCLNGPSWRRLIGRHLR